MPLAAARLLLVFSILLISCASASAWGRIGHQAIGYAADALLNDRARAEVGKLLALEGADNLAEVASWADQIRPEVRLDAPFHSIQIPLDATGYDRKRDCRTGRCIVRHLRLNIATLRDRPQCDHERLVALKYIVHFVGDVHQPFHVIDRRLGRALVMFDGVEDSNHHLWDSGILRAAGRKPAKLAKQLLAIMKTLPHDEDDLDPASWALETRDLARDVVLPAIPTGASPADRVLPPHYGQATIPLIETQLAKAARRLADVLNTTFAEPPAAAVESECVVYEPPIRQSRDEKDELRELRDECKRLAAERGLRGKKRRNFMEQCWVE